MGREREREKERERERERERGRGPRLDKDTWSQAYTSANACPVDAQVVTKHKQLQQTGPAAQPAQVAPHMPAWFQPNGVEPSSQVQREFPCSSPLVAMPVASAAQVTQHARPVLQPSKENGRFFVVDVVRAPNAILRI